MYTKVDIIYSAKDGWAMRKPIRTSFDELVQQNKKEILQDQKAISLIEAKLDAKHEQRREENYR